MWEELQNEITLVYDNAKEYGEYAKHALAKNAG
jgi:hypothetical protein